MKKLLCLLMLGGCATSNPAPAAHTTPLQCAEPAPVSTAPPPPMAAAAPVPQPAAASSNGLDDLATLTFDCPKAALNAAAREAAKVESEGTYQFSHFGIVSDSHQGVYEVHFKSNYQSEPVLRYCVALYCQQGWDPKKTQATVTLLGEPGSSPRGAAAADAACGGKHTHASARRVE